MAGSLEPARRFADLLHVNEMLIMDALPSHMAAVLLTGHGGLERLEFRTDVPVPEPGDGEVLIRVGAAGINNTDINTRLG